MNQDSTINQIYNLSSCENIIYYTVSKQSSSPRVYQQYTEHTHVRLPTHYQK